MDGIQHISKTTLVPSLVELVRKNQFGTSKEATLLHGTVKAAISDVYESLRTSLWSKLTLDMSVQKSLLLKRQLRGYKSLESTTKHHKEILANLVLHIYKKQHSRLISSIFQLIAGTLFFNMWSCVYLTTPKGEEKKGVVLWNVNIRFYRKIFKLIHNSGQIHLVDKISPTFRTQKNGIKNATVTQWWTGKQLCLV